MNKILIIKLWAIGDIVMATPMLNAIRAKYPNAEISWMVDIEYEEILKNHPQIDHLIAIETGKWRRLFRNAKIGAWLQRTRELNEQIRSQNYDLLVNCHAENWFTFFLCAAKKRVALYPFPEMPITHKLYDIVVPKPRRAGMHNTVHYLKGLEAVGIPQASLEMSLGETGEERPFWEEFCAVHQISRDDFVVVIAPFSTSPNRTFDIEFTTQTAAWLITEYNAKVIISGGPKDIAASQKIADDLKSDNVIPVAGETLRHYIALLRNANLVIASDSSPMHIAAAVKTPYIAIFGPTPAEERAPLVGNGIVLSKPIPCSPCDLPTCSNRIFRECLDKVTVADVKEAIRKLKTAAITKG